MHTRFYASGFIYNLSTQQILLQQLPLENDSNSLVWCLFKGEGQSGQNPQETFRKALNEQLSLTVPEKMVHSVYDYLSENKEQHFMNYAVVDVPADSIKSKEGQTIGWFNFRQLLRTPIHPQTKQDITVAERVINMKIRELLPPEEKPINQ